MPMGISPAPEIFQRKLTQALEGLHGIYIIADDILITGEGDTMCLAHRDHDSKLTAFLQRCREKNIKLNMEKFRLRKNEVSYIGHLLTAEGVKIDPGKMTAITEMPRPADVKGVQRFLGMINYLSKFCNHLSDECELLRQLTHRDSMWDWTEMHEEAFRKLKENVLNAPTLKYYNPEHSLILQCDASDIGLGAVLLQEEGPVAFGSRALSPTERGYAQIEKECLAIVFGMEKFHQYTYGRPVIVHSDHKPLETIVKKPLLKAPKRLQRMLLRLQKYDFEIKFLPGKDMLVADALSRAFLDLRPEDCEVDKDIESVNMVQYLPTGASLVHVALSKPELDRGGILWQGGLL
uniref:ribonuclease H n=1 Tax=Paramormyrops kingsleyae TaxID=1676925 RepID=A0A3B3SK60_9TELE